MSTARRRGSNRLVVGALVGLSWIVAVEYFFAYASAINARQEDPGRLLITAGSALAIGAFLLGGEYLLSRSRRSAGTDLTPVTRTTQERNSATARATFPVFARTNRSEGMD